MCSHDAASLLLPCLIWSLPTSVWERERDRETERERESAGEEERKKKECVPPLQFGEIYEWTKPKSVRVYTQREFGRRDLRSAAWVIIQSSCSHISHFESHRLWEGTDLSYTQVAHVQAPKSKEKQKKQNKKTTHAHNLVHQMLFHFRRKCDP